MKFLFVNSVIEKENILFHRKKSKKQTIEEKSTVLLDSVEPKFVIGQVVLVKWRFAPDWPATVSHVETKINKKSISFIYTVAFFPGKKQMYADKLNWFVSSAVP